MIPCFYVLNLVVFWGKGVSGKQGIENFITVRNVFGFQYSNSPTFYFLRLRKETVPLKCRRLRRTLGDVKLEPPWTRQQVGGLRSHQRILISRTSSHLRVWEDSPVAGPEP